MKTIDEIQKEIDTIRNHKALHLPAATIFTNPKGALIQTDLNAWLFALDWVLGNGKSIKELYDSAWIEHDD